MDGAGAQGLPRILLVFGVLLLLAGALSVAYAVLQNWWLEQDRNPLSQGTVPLSLPDGLEETTQPIVTDSPPLPAGSIAEGTGSTPAVTTTADPAAQPVITAALEPTAQPPVYPAPVQIRIPALSVTRSIIQAPRVRNSQTGSWTWNVDRLFRQGRRDLVGHLEGSASPGQAGNMILAGHNYGYGVNGVFVRLGRLKPGQKIHVVNKTGETFTYLIVEVERVKWRGNEAEQLAKHWEYLSFTGPERLTLMTCGGADFEPFPERIYVVAEPQASGSANSP
jgi:hypothetical protein